MNKIRVKNCYTALDLLRNNNFIRNDGFENIFFEKFLNLFLLKYGLLCICIFIDKCVKYV